MSQLYLVPIYCAGTAVMLQPLAERLSRIFDLSVTQQNPDFDVEEAFDANRGQYSSRGLLERLLRQAPASAARVLGVAGVDLFVPVLTYVFGEAELGGRGALVSSFRLDNELYGLPPDPQLLFERLVKEAVHELGHTHGLVHCDLADCVMRASTYVEGIDLKSERFCGSCQRVVAGARAGR
jgi:archaemetzincin